MSAPPMCAPLGAELKAGDCAVMGAVIMLLVTALILLWKQPPILSSFAPQG